MDIDHLEPRHGWRRLMLLIIGGSLGSSSRAVPLVAKIGDLSIAQRL